MLMETQMDWTVQLPAASAVVAVVVIFLKFMGGKSKEHIAQMERLAQDCHQNQLKVAEQQTAQIERVCATRGRRPRRRRGPRATT